MNSRIGAVMVAAVLCVMLSAAVAPALAQGTATAPTIKESLTGDYGYHLPPNIGMHDYAAKADTLIDTLHVFMIALFVGWGAFFTMCLVKFRARPGHKADPKPVKAKVSKWAEVGVALFEAVLLIGLSIPAWASVKNNFPAESENPVHLRVVAEQFQWNFHYPGPDGVFGRTSPAFLDTATNPLGLDPNDAHGKDDIYAAEMHIPVNRPVIADITSKDVIHSFFVSVLRVKQDAIPGMRIPIWFEAGKTGNYEISCAQLCGNNHYSMRALMRVQDEDAYDAWYAKAAKGPEEFNEDEFD